MTTEPEYVHEVVYDHDGEPLARAYVSPDISDRSRAALVELCRAVRRHIADDDYSIAPPAAAPGRARGDST